MECENDTQVTEEILEEKVFLAGLGKGSKNGEMKKSCPIKCGKLHTNGSLFFCNQFGKKEPDEKKAIQTKLHILCILCLGWKGNDPVCPVKSCAKCGVMHNVLLYNS